MLRSCFPLPPPLMQVERAVMHTVLRLPQNALGHSDLINLHLAGGPKLRSISAACASAFMRTSLKTIKGWSGWLPQLKLAADALLPLHPSIRDCLTPPFWDSPPLALSLSEASKGLPSHPQWNISNSDLIHKLQTRDLTKVPVQKLLYAELASSRFKDPLPNVFQKRLNDLFHPYDLDWSGNRFDEPFQVLKKCTPATATKVIKGWCNGWATSRRYQEGVLLPCLFGCINEEDDLSHYLICPHLFALWKFLVEDVSDMPLARWGVANPNEISMNQIACVFAGYHATRRHFKAKSEVFFPDQSILSGPQIRAAWTTFAETFHVEASQLAMQCRKFSVPTFLSYLNGTPDCLTEGNTPFFHIGEGINSICPDFRVLDRTSDRYLNASFGSLSPLTDCLNAQQESVPSCLQSQGRRLSAGAELPDSPPNTGDLP